MIKDPVVLLQNLVLSLSDALDLVDLVAADHQLRWAYIALRPTLSAARSPGEQPDLLYAAAPRAGETGPAWADHPEGMHRG